MDLLSHRLWMYDIFSISYGARGSMLFCFCVNCSQRGAAAVLVSFRGTFPNSDRPKPSYVVPPFRHKWFVISTGSIIRCQDGATVSQKASFNSTKQALKVDCNYNSVLSSWIRMPHILGRKQSICGRPRVLKECQPQCTKCRSMHLQCVLQDKITQLGLIIHLELVNM